jgi:Putative DNA-binding domain
MPRLLEIQRAVNRCLIERDQEAVAPFLTDGSPINRLDIYHNTIFSGLTKALCLTYPAVQRLVGVDFFEGVAQLFIVWHPPRAACLNCYGGEFPDFLRDLPAATAVAYLADVARLEWAVNCAIHAPDIEPFEFATLTAIDPGDRGGVSFTAHPSVHLVRADYPVDLIWRAVLADDDRALRAIDLSSGLVHLVAGRRSTGVEVVRLEEKVWRFLAELYAGRPIQAAINSCADFDAAAALAQHLAFGWFVAFKLAAPQALAPDFAA